MAIFSTFDVGLKAEKLTFFQEKFGTDKVILIERSLLFAGVRILIPVLGYLLIIGVILWLTGLVGGSSLTTIIGIPLGIILFLTMIFRIGKVYIDYILDFTIITPEEAISYNQTGVLNRRVKTMQTEKIKTVSAKKSGLLFSLFDNGDIIIFAEGDQSGGAGEINLNRVKSPEKTKKQILKIVDIAKAIHQGIPL